MLILTSYIDKNLSIGSKYVIVLSIIGLCNKYNLSYYHEINEDEWTTFLGILCIPNVINRRIDISKYEIKEAIDIFKENDLINLINLYKNNLYVIQPIKNIYEFINTQYDIIYNSLSPKIQLAMLSQNNIDLIFKRGRISVSIHIDKDDKISYLMYKNLIEKIKTRFSKSCFFYIFTYGSDSVNKLSEDFDNIEYYRNMDIYKTFYHLSQANILVISNSSFSYLAGLYNINTVIYLTNKYPMLSRWINIL